MTETPQPRGQLPAYIAFRTLLDIVERMEEEGPPTRVDSTYLDRYAGGYRPTIINNLQTLGLLKKSGQPTDELLALVKADTQERKALIDALLKEHYADVFALGLNSTQGQFLEVFTNRGANGDTRRKAASFFLKACAYAGVETGTHWKTPAVPSKGTKRKSVNQRDNTKTVIEKDPPDDSSTQRGGEDMAVVHLRSGGTVTLTLKGSSLTMPKDDRTFVFSIVDLMQEYDLDPTGTSEPVSSELPEEEL